MNRGAEYRIDEGLSFKVNSANFLIANRQKTVARSGFASRAVNTLVFDQVVVRKSHFEIPFDTLKFLSLSIMLPTILSLSV